MGQELVIKINGDVAGYNQALSEARSETQALGSELDTIALASGVALAALTAEIYLSVKALNVEAEALDSVTQALQNQGIYSDDLARSYRATAEAIEAKTGIDGDAISSAQASTQALIGQTVMTDELTRAVVDFSAGAKIEMKSAFDLIGKAISGQTSMLSRYGIKLDDTGSKQGNAAAITELLAGKYGGMAEKAANATGSTVLLESAVGNLQKEIGRRLAPTFDAIIGKLTGFVNVTKDSKAGVDLIVSIIAGGTAAAAAAVGISLAVKGYTALKVAQASVIATTAASNVLLGTSTPAAAGAAILSIKTMTAALRSASLATKVLVGSTGIGLLVIIASEIYLNWASIWLRMQAIFNAFAENIIDLASGIGKILYAVFVPGADTLKNIQEGAKQVMDALKKGYATATASTEQFGPPVPGEQDAGKAGVANKNAALERAEQARKLETKRASIELMRLEDAKASQDMLDLKKGEIDILKALEEEKDAEIRAIQTRRLEGNRALQVEQEQIDKERRALIQEEILAENEAYQAMTEEQQQRFRDANMQKLEQDALTKRTIKEKAALEEAKVQTAANNKFLLEQQKFGTAYALINKAMHSAVFQGTKSAFGELSALQESSNNTLKSIGKVSAIASVVIKTAESAMNIYAGFSTIPIIGPALGVAGAAAAVAFGAEQVGKIKGANRGGIMTGGIKGIDSIPAMLTPGEIVAPEKNFDEVIGSVRAAREAENFLGGAGAQGGASDPRMLAALESIDAKLSSLDRPNITVAGDVLSDDAFLQTLAQKLSDGLEFGNLKIFGVNVGT